MAEAPGVLKTLATVGGLTAILATTMTAGELAIITGLCVSGRIGLSAIAEIRAQAIAEKKIQEMSKK